jgi:F0F1-type ATP synthase alpha subunit
MSGVSVIDRLIREVQEQIENTDLHPEFRESGIILSVADGIVRVGGLRSVAYNEVVIFESGAQ